MALPFELPGEFDSPVIATAIHAGHDLRPEIRARLVLDESTRLREEDPFTQLMAEGVGCPVVANRSRFEVDLNRPRHQAVYRTPADCWGLEVWDGDLPDDVVGRSLEVYDAFYEALGERLDRLAARGPFVVFDVHSYNYRRDGATTAAPPADNPDVNVGTGSMDRARWATVVDSFIDSLRDVDVFGDPLDVRENVRFKGANLARWVHERYPDRGCAIAIEFKKTFMDEWTGVVDEQHLDALAGALQDALPALQGALELVS
jgi:N-formylglutamate amidohydrolase